MAAQDNLGRQWYHGTYEKLSEGTELIPGAKRNKQNFPPAGDNTAVYLEPSVYQAHHWGQMAAKSARRKNVHIYQVQPLDEPIDTGKGFKTSSAKILKKVSSVKTKR